MVARGDKVRPPPGEAEGRSRWRERWTHFVYDGQGEMDRFGIFDPFLRMMFAVAVALGLALGIGTTLETWGRAMGPSAVGLATALGISGLAAGIWLYKAIWRTPSEREILLQMAREADEATRLRARHEEGPRGMKKG
jgi:hypothetical protein